MSRTLRAWGPIAVSGAWGPRGAVILIVAWLRPSHSPQRIEPLLPEAIAHA
jgi:hypothetical protein